ncbi:CPBP family intramembrane glutamic endopeptidase [Corynebacterium callunae]|uniref:CPBP family intramembrane glutamic endopeptidase n=1 Tax=Corynebacterium callunae TaxID=1721 RepID=UPI001FFEFF9D|nr:CPBP family intramembrane metalloprotease [Corynebacterium callunae]
MWLAIYVVTSIVALNIGVNSGISFHSAAVIALVVLSMILLVYLLRTGIGSQIGLGVTSKVPILKMWIYLPLLILPGLPLIKGIRDDLTIFVAIIIVLHYLFVGFLEEVLFRGLLFHALLQKGKVNWAVIVTALTFGFGHAASLLIGQSSADTTLQIIDAMIVGLLFTAVVLKTGSLHAVIVIRILYNVVAEFSPSVESFDLLIPAILVLMNYGAWLFYGVGRDETSFTVQESKGILAP